MNLSIQEKQIIIDSLVLYKEVIREENRRTGVNDDDLKNLIIKFDHLPEKSKNPKIDLTPHFNNF